MYSKFYLVLLEFGFLPGRPGVTVVQSSFSFDDAIFRSCTLRCFAK